MPCLQSLHQRHCRLLTCIQSDHADSPGLTVLWVQALMREGILVSPRMMADHMPDYLTAVLRTMTKRRGHPSTTSGTVTLDMEETDQGNPEELDH